VTPRHSIIPWSITSPHSGAPHRIATANTSCQPAVSRLSRRKNRMTIIGTHRFDCFAGLATKVSCRDEQVLTTGTMFGSRELPQPDGRSAPTFQVLKTPAGCRAADHRANHRLMFGHVTEPEPRGGGGGGWGGGGGGGGGGGEGGGGGGGGGTSRPGNCLQMKNLKRAMRAFRSRNRICNGRTDIRRRSEQQLATAV